MLLRLNTIIAYFVHFLCHRTRFIAPQKHTHK